MQKNFVETRIKVISPSSLIVRCPTLSKIVLPEKRGKMTAMAKRNIPGYFNREMRKEKGNLEKINTINVRINKRGNNRKS